jgi:FkbM family methyltransferase
LNFFSKKISNNIELISIHYFNNLNKFYKFNDIFFDVSNKTLLLRSIRLLTKEKDTIWWIDNIFTKHNDTFLDIGANMGSYSLYSANKYHSLNIHAFEPESENYNILCRNVKYNDKNNQINTYNLAISNLNYLNKQKFLLSSNTPGKSGHNLNSIKSQNKFADTISVLSTSIDYLVKIKILKKISHVKIDVDGAEFKIIEGMRNTLLSRSVKSIIIEFNGSKRKINKYVSLICSFGYSQVKPPTIEQNNYFFLQDKYYKSKKHLFSQI